MPRSLALFVSLLALLAAVGAPLAAFETRAGELPTTCIIDGVVFDDCPLDDDLPPWDGSGHGNLPVMKPDLGARGGGFAVFPSILSPGTPFEAYAVIENFGGLDFPADNEVKIDFYLVPPSATAFAADNLIGSAAIVFPHVTSAAIGEVGVLVSIAGNLPEIADGQYQLGVDIDADDTLVELDEANNRVYAGDPVSVGGGVDLVPAVDGFSVNSPVTVGDTLTITSTLRNAGTLPVNGFAKVVVRYRAVPEGGDDLGGTVLGTSIVTIASGTSLAAGAARQVPPLSVPVQLPPGTYVIGADVDFSATNGNGVVPEFNELNNSGLLGTLVVNATPVGPPDYAFEVAEVLDQERDPISAGYRLTLRVRLKSTVTLGLPPQFYPEISVKASDDATITGSDMTLRTFPQVQAIFGVPGIPIHNDVELEVPWPASLTSGQFFIGVIVDPRNAVSESNEGNNAALAGAVKAGVECLRLPELEDAQVLFEDIFTSDAPLVIGGILEPPIGGEVCSDSFREDVDVFNQKPDSCFFSVPYDRANNFVELELLPAMQRQCTTEFEQLASFEPLVVLKAHATATTLQNDLAKNKELCDLGVLGSVTTRRYCACSNPDYLDWAPPPGPGDCGFRVTPLLPIGH